MTRSVMLILLSLFFVLLFTMPVNADPVALQSADTSCATKEGRFVDCGNGTVTDNLTGLIWTKNASCWGNSVATWDRASIEVLNLADGFCGLNDNSSPGEWRLPTREEWEEFTEAAVNIGGCDPVVTNDAGDDCWGTGPSSFENIVGFEFGFYWSATTVNGTPSEAYLILMINGVLDGTSKAASSNIWAVRGGQ